MSFSAALERAVLVQGFLTDCGRRIKAGKMKARSDGRRKTTDLHFLNDDGMVACNPRDREAAHRAEVEGIATENLEAVTCKKCLGIIRKMEGRGR